jgi:hypothetical protein
LGDAPNKEHKKKTQDQVAPDSKSCSLVSLWDLIGTLHRLG